MKEFKIEISETLQKTIKVKAKDFNEAYNKVLEDYRNGDIILDSNDFVDYEIKEI